MITAVRTFTIQSGSQPEAIAALGEIASYLRENFGAVGHIERNISGSPDNVHYVSESDSLAAYESRLKKVQADEKIMNMYRDFVKTYVSETHVLLLERVS